MQINSGQFRKKCYNSLQRFDFVLATLYIWDPSPSTHPLALQGLLLNQPIRLSICSTLAYLGLTPKIPDWTNSLLDCFWIVNSWTNRGPRVRNPVFPVSLLLDIDDLQKHSWNMISFCAMGNCWVQIKGLLGLEIGEPCWRKSKSC